jgi:peptidoglycan/xylan/chitin deacetylase (PgdA/CDA1 family)
MTLNHRVAALSLAVAASSCGPAASQPATRAQVVMISFDGANDIAQWQRSRRLAAITGARFTYFLSCVFLLSPATKDAYQPPREVGRKRSNVGFAASQADVAARLRQIWQARSEGHDIASHGCGHFDGGSWKEATWASELSAFRTILREAWTVNALAGEPDGWRGFVEDEVVGFRAPYLSVGPGLAPALRDAGYRYDASGVSRGPAQSGVDNGLITFALPQVPEGPNGRRVIAMDYNLFVRHSGGFERGDADGEFEERTLAAFRSAFKSAYAGDRPPLSLGFHFTLMNDGAYWRALERFAQEICVRADVACISHADHATRLDGAQASAAPPDG